MCPLKQYNWATHYITYREKEEKMSKIVRERALERVFKNKMLDPKIPSVSYIQPEELDI